VSSIINAGDYNIYVGNDLLKRFDLLFANKNLSASEKIILVDENTRKHCLPFLLQQISSLQNTAVFELKCGEEGKSILTIESIWNQLSNSGADRNSVLINLGGGALCDAGAFAAATFMRGIGFINIPTTLLAMVDASVGGKNGINFEGIKNRIGTFTNPLAVFTAPIFLETLSEDEMRNGFAEVIKHALISDKEKWNEVKQTDVHFKNVDWENIITESVSLKNKIVQSDFRDYSLRKALNFGHTIGHALESFSMKHYSSPLKHGEAVAVGMIAETWLSEKLCSFPREDAMEIYSFINKTFPKRISFNATEVIELMKGDKKNAERKINFSLLKSIGEPVLDILPMEDLINNALEFISEQFNSVANPI
jgi:3-dehydroquinate synthase